MRLQTYIARAGVCSRRKAEDLIVAGRVTVNGTAAAVLGTQVKPDSDIVAVDGKPLAISVREVYLFHKPRSVISTMSDPRGRPCLGDYTKALSGRVFPVGRLDFDVSGLLLFTNDGDFANQLLHPKFNVPRTYIARVSGDRVEESLRKLVEGISLDDGPAKAVSARFLRRVTDEVRTLVGTPQAEDEVIVELRVAEGRKHFVKRALSAVGLPVIRLSRTSFGNYTLSDIPPGEFRRIGLPGARQAEGQDEKPVRKSPPARSASPKGTRTPDRRRSR